MMNPMMFVLFQIRSAIAATCVDDPSYDCNGQAWAYNCGAPGYCETMQKCQSMCINRGYQPSCDTMQTATDQVCGGAAGGAPSTPTTGCTRSYGYKGFIGTDNEFISGRDGVVSRSGDYITVIEERPTPSWCLNPTVRPPPKGWTGHWKDYYQQTGLHKLACVGWTEANHRDATCTSNICGSCDTSKYPDRTGVFSYEAFAQAAGYFADFAGYNNWKQSALDVAAFVSHSTKETMGATPTAENGWCWIGELGYDTAASPNCAYGCVSGSGNTSAVCNDGIIGTSLTNTPPIEYSDPVFRSWNGGYWGRGSIQLSYCYNYMYFSDWVENGLLVPKSPETDFFTNPGMVGTQDWAFAAGLWFYMSPSSDGMKPSMHSMVDYWGDDIAMPVDNQNRPADFGYQVNILNGGIECSGDYHYAKLRQESMNIIMTALNFPDMRNGSYLHMPELQIAGCEGAVLGYNPHVYWTINGTQCSGDSINVCVDDGTEACSIGAGFSGSSGSVVQPTQSPVVPEPPVAPPMAPTAPPAVAPTVAPPVAPPVPPTQPPVVPNPPTTGGSNGCVVKPGLEAYAAYCELGKADQAVCIAYGNYCEWKATDGSTSGGNSNTGSGSASGSKCVAAVGFESYEAWCGSYTSFGQDQCNNGTNGFCQWA